MLRRTDLLVRQTIIVRQGNRRLKPTWPRHRDTARERVSGALRARKSKTESCHRGILWGSWRSDCWQRLSLAHNDEVARRGNAPTTNEAALSRSSTPPWLTEDAARDRSNRLLDDACVGAHFD